ncbi:hypothetical protein PMAYCL1PPCAC_31683, partial [Pristionchus mayeri]
WIRATPKNGIDQPEMPIFEMDFGGQKLRVTTSKVRIGDQTIGPLNMYMQLWQQLCVRCNANGCDAFTNGASVGKHVTGGFSHPSSSLVIAPLPEDREIPLYGELSRFSIFDRVITDKEIAQYTFECSSFVRNEDLSGDQWWTILEQVPRSSLVTPGLCESSNCWPGVCEGTIDKSPPISTFCPSDIFLNSTRPMSIFWSEPVFEDDNEIKNIVSNYRSGDIFSKGEHHIVYTATDTFNNTGRCEFDIYLAPDTCEKPTRPAQGTIIYKETFDGASGIYSTASVQCDDPRFPLDGPKFYTCDYMGNWRRSYYSPFLKPPSCGKVAFPVNETLWSEHENLNVETEMENSEIIYKCGADTPLLFESDGIMLCSEVPAGFFFDEKEQAKFACPFDQYQDQSNKEECKPCPNGTITSYEGATKASDCYQNCDAGSYCNFDTSLGDQGAFDQCCQLCTIGKFMNGTGSINECTPCKGGRTTKNEGSTSEDVCYWPCVKGQEVDDTTGECRDCDTGMYKDTDDIGQCIKCKDGLTTSGFGSTSASDCNILYCPENKYVNPSPKCSLNIDNFNLNDFCLPCKQRTMQSQPNSTTCADCPNTPDLNIRLPPSCRLENECSPLLEGSCGPEMICLKWPDIDYYHCVDNHSEQRDSCRSIVWWHILLVAVGSLVLAALVAAAVIFANRCCKNMRKLQIIEIDEEDADSFSRQRRSTQDNYVGVVPDRNEDDAHSPENESYSSDSHNGESSETENTQ